MKGRRFCLGVNDQFGEPIEKQIGMIGEAGYDAVFFPYRGSEEIRTWCNIAKADGMEVQSLHAPFSGCRDLWGDDAEKADRAMQEIGGSIVCAANNGVPIVVSHAYIGFDLPALPFEKGLERYGRLISLAEREGVKLAFENTEGEEYLQAILETFGGSPAVGFCIDTGHRHCYNRDADLITKYGDLLVATHINDNLGIKDKGGHIFWHDDLHLLPFDGTVDWEETARKLAAVRYTGTLTFELNTKSKPGRHENDRYGEMPLRAYLAQSFRRARRFEKLLSEAESGCKNRNNMVKYCHQQTRE